jgi:HlyD family secretion protein
MVLVVIFGFVFGWFAHRTRVRQALAALENANLTRGVAEIAVVEYAEGIFLQDLATVQREISSAETALRLAEEQLDRSKRIGEKDDGPETEVVFAEREVKRARLDLEQARKRRMTLEQQTKVKMLAGLKSDLEQAKADEKAKAAVYTRLKASWMGLSW